MSWPERVFAALVLLLAVAWAGRVIWELLAPLVPALVILVLLLAIGWFILPIPTPPVAAPTERRETSMPSQSHRDDLPAHYRVQFLRRVAAAVIQSADRRRYAAPRRPGDRAAAPDQRSAQLTPEGRLDVAHHPERPALPRSPHLTNDEADISAERLREHLRRTEF
jgi:hypothetical protein